MLKKSAYLFVLFTLVFSGASAYADGPIVKLGRGLTNIVTAPVEYIAQTTMIAEEHNAGVAFVGGLVRGTFFTVVRILGGAFETVTFFAPIPWNDNPWPENYEPLMSPETGLELLAEQQGRRSYLQS